MHKRPGSWEPTAFTSTPKRAFTGWRDCHLSTCPTTPSTDLAFDQRSQARSRLSQGRQGRDRPSWSSLRTNPLGKRMNGTGTNNHHEAGVGERSGWAAGDQEGAPFKGRGVEPVRYLDASEH